MDKVFILGRDTLPEAVRLGAGESLHWTILVLPEAAGGSHEIRADVLIEFCGEGASADIAGLYLCPDSERVQLNVNLRHLSGGCTSTQLFKGIAGGSARAEFDGLIYVAEGAAGTKAHQASNSILLSEKAVVEARPQLEIYNDDVECSHGTTSGFLNPEELFYMRSRGIPEAEARQLQMISFVSAVLKRLPESLAQEAMEAMKHFR